MQIVRIFTIETMGGFHEIKFLGVCCKVIITDISSGTQWLILHSVKCLTHERYPRHYKWLGFFIPIYLAKYDTLRSPHIGFVVEASESYGSVKILGLVVNAIYAATGKRIKPYPFPNKIQQWTFVAISPHCDSKYAENWLLQNAGFLLFCCEMVWHENHTEAFSVPPTIYPRTMLQLDVP